MTAVGCDTFELNPPQHSIKQREKYGLAGVTIYLRPHPEELAQQASRRISATTGLAAILRDAANGRSSERENVSLLPGDFAFEGLANTGRKIFRLSQRPNDGGLAKTSANCWNLAIPMLAALCGRLLGAAVYACALARSANKRIML
jgi:hypothetical protein